MGESPVSLQTSSVPRCAWRATDANVSFLVASDDQFSGTVACNQWANTLSQVPIPGGWNKLY
jgi:hypothetical protein